MPMKSKKKSTSGNLIDHKINDTGRSGTVSSLIRENQGTGMKNVTTTTSTSSIKSFHTWLNELSWVELQDALQFTISTSLLKDMVQQQLPLSTPIHPRAIPFTPASKYGKSYYEKCSDYTTQQRDDRLKKPRLLKFMNTSPFTSSSTAANICTTTTEAEEAKLLEMLTGVKPSRNNNKKQSSKSSSNNNNNNNSPIISCDLQYDVIARQFRQDDGQLWSVPEAIQQFQNDNILLTGTVIVLESNNNNVGTTNTTCRLDLFGLMETTITQCSSSSSSSNTIKDDLLDILRQTSRGNFGKTEITVSQSSLFPSWFDPTDRWFSLSMYLAARYEMALWNAFHQHQNHQMPQPAYATAQNNSQLASSLDSLSDSMLSKFTATALIRTMSETLREDQQSIKKQFHIRDSTIFDLLMISDNYCLLPSNNSRKKNHDLCYCSLLEIDNNLTWRYKLLYHLEQIIAEYNMQSLLAKESISRRSSSEETVGIVNSANNSNKKRKKRKKKQKKSGNIHDTSHDVTTKRPSSIDTDNVIVTQPNSEEDEEEDDSILFGSPSNGSALVPKTTEIDMSATTRERNRNTVIVLSIIEDTINQVFQKIGFEEELINKKQSECDDNGGSSMETGFVVVEQRKAQQHRNADTVENKFTKRNSKSRQTSSKAFDRTTVNKGSIRSHSLGRKKPWQSVQRKEQYVKAKQKVESISAGIQQPKNSKSVVATVGSERIIQRNNAAWQQPVIALDDPKLFPPIRRTDDDEIRSSSEPNQEEDLVCFSRQQQNLFHNVDPTATIRTSNVEGFSSSYSALSPGFFYRPDPLASTLPWEITGISAVDDWDRLRGFAVSRDESILSEFFDNKEKVDKKSSEDVIASSTAASIASSEGEDAGKLGSSSVIDEKEDDISSRQSEPETRPDTPKVEDRAILKSLTPNSPSPSADAEVSSILTTRSGEESSAGSPSPPSTPSPRLSPILVSLSDLSRMKKEKLGNLEIPTVRSLASDPADPSPKLDEAQPRMVNSLSRENLRSSSSAEEQDRKKGRKSLPFISDSSYKSAATRSINTSRDDYDIKDKATIRRSADAVSSYRIGSSRAGLVRDDYDIRVMTRETPPRISSYRNAVARVTRAPSVKSAMSDTSPKKHSNQFQFYQGEQRFSTTRSETALDGQDDYQSWHVRRPSKTDDPDNITITKDGSTTITSAGLSQRENELITTLREERNAYRDMCLTLGAEVAKLRSLLAAQKTTVVQHSVVVPAEHAFHGYRGSGVFDPTSISHYIAPRAKTLAAMSDAGYRGEHESLASEDEAGGKLVMNESSRQLSSGITLAESDASLGHNSGHNLVQTPLCLQPSKDINDQFHGMQSRLAKDIFQFVATTNAQLRKLDSKRQMAVERMTRLVKTVWPRAQVNLYGSHVTGLCVPTSDIDFVICLPAVHKNAVAAAAGALEGRNAINETSQKTLARRLKGESWIDPRSIKLIERTVVPVIKVATKDTKAKTLHLDISFDAPGHHGLHAVQMATAVMEELPMLRPLVIVLKQFLIDRSLLQAYTGGLSSYCLFLMVARYLQEQTSETDVGSLLMGFLDFYGNHFNPRSTGISVRHRQFFMRPNYITGNQAPETIMNGNVVWNQATVAARAATPTSDSGPYIDRRNSFNDKGKPRKPPVTFNQSAYSHQVPEYQHAELNAFDNRTTYTFDPLFVEDPLSEGNNVGRNAFRIFQVQRAFSDAHRALVASLEWDLHSTGEMQDTNEFPLLKCLLQSEDVVFDL